MIVFVFSLLLTAPFTTAAQQAAKVYRIGYLSYRAPGKTDRYPDLVAELVRLKADVLLSQGTIMTLAAKQGTTTVPIVMVYIDDPVASGIVSNLARPGANVTGRHIRCAKT